MKHFLIILVPALLLAMYAKSAAQTVSQPPTAAQSIPLDQENARQARALLDQAIQALGGDAYLNVHDIETARPHLQLSSRTPHQQRRPLLALRRVSRQRAHRSHQRARYRLPSTTATKATRSPSKDRTRSRKKISTTISAAANSPSKPYYESGRKDPTVALLFY